jgi:hypothetical protein
MKRKPPPEEAGFQSNCRSLAERSYHELAETRKNGRISDPIHNFQSTMAFCQVPKMPVIPALQVTAINRVEVDRSLEQTF